MKTTKVNEYDKETGERCIAKITFDEEDLRKIVHKTLENNDFVQVVRCKDCKHHEELLNNNNGDVLCWVHDIDVVVDRNGYCNYGERKEQDHK